MTMVGCTPESVDGPAAVATAYVGEFSAWAQAGYPSSIPATLLAYATDETREVLEQDQQWRVRGGVRNDGPIHVRKTEILELTDRTAVVAVTLDTTDLTVLAEGEPTFMNDQRIHVTEFILEKTDRWRVSGATGGEK